MKKVMLIGLSLLSSAAFAGNSDIGSSGDGASLIKPPSFGAYILPEAQIKSVDCYESTVHRGHNWSTIGSVEVEDSEGQILRMEMYISRFAPDEQLEGKALCREMTLAKRSKKKVNVIYTEHSDFDGSCLTIKGTAPLKGLTPLGMG